MNVALIGTGSRGIGMWGKSMVDAYAPDHVELVGLCDLNPGRLAFAKEYIGVDCPTYAHTEFGKMIDETRPDRVIVTTVDGTHHQYIIEAMQKGCDVISEKPITTEAEHARAIIEAQRQTGRDLIATFNVRYMPTMAEVKRLLMSERVGRVTSVDFHWYLDTSHGASYFRRWHGVTRHSGTLLVHKASHHFDVLNWWLGSEPATVFAHGDLTYYGRNNPYRSTHCRDCAYTDTCEFYWDMTRDAHAMQLYAENEHHDGYLRDACLWRDEVDIFDRMSVQIRYANEVSVSYSLSAFLPYEGFRIAFNGTKGRLETWIQYRQAWPREAFDEIRITDNFGYTELVRVPHATGAHGGADDLLKDAIFLHPDAPDPLGQRAGLRDGIMGVLIGIGARQSIAESRPVEIGELTPLQPRAVRA